MLPNQSVPNDLVVDRSRMGMLELVSRVKFRFPSGCFAGGQWKTGLEPPFRLPGIPDDTLILRSQSCYSSMQRMCATAFGENGLESPSLITP